MEGPGFWKTSEIEDAPQLVDSTLTAVRGLAVNIKEQVINFDLAGESLVGMACVPEQARSIGIIVVVGGPQYRVGSHRQFLLLSRALASAGYPVMRFDYRGMGDSTWRTPELRELLMTTLLPLSMHL